MSEIDREETPEETIHNLRIICGCKQDEIERLQKRVAELEQLVVPVEILKSWLKDIEAISKALPAAPSPEDK